MRSQFAPGCSWCHASKLRRAEPVSGSKMERKTCASLKGGNAMKMASALIVAVIAIASALLLARPKTSSADLLASHDSSASNGGIERQVIASEKEGLDALKA